MAENNELNAVALRFSKAFCDTQKFECGEIEILCSLLDEFSLASKGCEYNYFECEVQNDLYLSLEWEFDKIWFNFYDVNASQSVFCYGVECSNDWNGASEIINELEKLTQQPSAQQRYCKHLKKRAFENVSSKTITMNKFIKKMSAVENNCKRASEWHTIKRNNKRIRFCMVYAI